MKNLVDHGTWIMVPRRQMLAKKKKPVRTKFVFKKKLLKSGEIQYKSRLVACGYTQIPGVDYSADELYASVCSYSSMRFLLSLATQKNFLGRSVSKISCFTTKSMLWVSHK